MDKHQGELSSGWHPFEQLGPGIIITNAGIIKCNNDENEILAKNQHFIFSFIEYKHPFDWMTFI